MNSKLLAERLMVRLNKVLSTDYYSEVYKDYIEIEFKISDDGTAEQFTYIDIDYTIVPMNEIREIRNYIKVQQN